MSVAVYIRWSTDDQGSGTTLEVQRDACLKWASERGYTIAPEHIFIDDGVSGAKEHRPALDRMNKLIQKGVINLVIVYKIDRLARSQYVMFKLVEKDWSKKASLASVSESFDMTTTHGKAAFGMSALFAATERDMIRDRTLSGKRKRAVEGTNPGIRQSYGYHTIDKKFTVIEEEAAIVCRIYNEYLSGRTDGQIARSLNDAGIRTRAGGPWHISAVQRILQNPAYKGTLVYGEVTKEGAFPPIVDTDSWDRAQSMRQGRAKIHPRRLGTESPYILSGRLTCAKCGRPMNGRVCRNGKYENRYYMCTGYLQFRDCDCLSVRQEGLERQVVLGLLPLLDEEELNRRIKERAGTTLDLLRQEVEALEASLTGFDKQMVRVRHDYRQGSIDAATFNDLRAEIDCDRKAVADSLSLKKSEVLSAEDVAKVGEDVRQAVTLLRSWEGLSFTQRRQVIHLLTERILWDYHAKQLTVQTTI